MSEPSPPPLERVDTGRALPEPPPEAVAPLLRVFTAPAERLPEEEDGALREPLLAVLTAGVTVPAPETARALAPLARVRAKEEPA